MNISDWVLDDEEDSAALNALQKDMEPGSDESYFSWATGWLNENRSMFPYLMTEEMVREELTGLIIYLENYSQDKEAL